MNWCIENNNVYLDIVKLIYDIKVKGFFKMVIIFNWFVNNFISIWVYGKGYLFGYIMIFNLDYYLG